MTEILVSNNVCPADLSMEGLLIHCTDRREPSRPSSPHASFFAKEFFVSWSGVLTLVYVGFPQAVLDLKARLDSTCPALLSEFPGSKWPKTSLAAVDDEQASISFEQLAILREICAAANAQLRKSASDRLPLHFDSFSYVHFQNRCLSQFLLRLNIPFRGHSAASVSQTSPSSTQCESAHQSDVPDGLPGIDADATALQIIAPPTQSNSWPPPDEVFNTDSVVEQANNPDYWKFVAKHGNRRSHYMGPASGTTLCCFLSDADAASEHKEHLLSCIQSFRAMVQDRLPGVYSFFPTECLHITIRGMS
eukprot:jgi/Ulvmu1/2023/UM120_0019.1